MNALRRFFMRSGAAIGVAVFVGAGAGNAQAVSVTPDGGNLTATSGVATFVITNNLNIDETFDLFCGGGGAVTGCEAPPAVQVQRGGSVSVDVTYSTGAGASGTLSLSAAGEISGESDDGWYDVTVGSPGVAVTPDGATAPTRLANTSGYSETFTVTNTGPDPMTFSFVCGGAGGVFCGTVPSPVNLSAFGVDGYVTTVSMPYSVGGPGTGTLTLTASGGGVSDPGSYTVLIATYGVSVIPDGGTAPTRTANTGGYSESFTVTNTGSTSNTFSFTCTGSAGVTCGTVPSPVPLANGAQAPLSMPYSVGAPGTGTLTLTASGTNTSDPGSFSVPIVSYGVTVTPDGNTTATRTANTGGYSETFTVTNMGSGQNTFSFSCSGATGVTCGAIPGPVTLAANGVTGYQTTVGMPYSVGAPGTSTLTLTANGTNASDPGSFSVPIVSFGVTVTPDGGTAATRTPNTGGYSESFTVTNTGSGSNTFSFSCSGAGGVTCGTVPSPIPLASGAQQAVSMPYSVGAAGTGTLTLTASGTNASDPGSFSVPIVSFGVTVTPDGGTAATRTANTGGYSESFTVTNTGSSSNTFSFSCSGAGGVTCGTVPSTIPLASGAQQAVSMPYSVGAPGTGTLTLTASGTNASDPGSFSVPIVSYGVSVTPDGGTAPHRPQDTGGYTESFTVTNSGSASNTFSFTCAGTGGVTCGTVPTPIPVANGAQAPVSMPYSVGAPGTGTLTLTASGTNASDQGSYSVPIDCTACFAASTITGGVFTKDSRYLLQETADSYDPYGRIAQLTDARTKVTTYLYGGNVNTAFLIKVTRLHDASGSIDLVTDIAYDTDGFVSSIKDEGGSFRYFTYDLFGQLRQIKNNAGTPVRAYGYTYSRTSPNWTFDPANPNAVVDSTFLQQTPSVQVVVSSGYLDGLGRAIQSVVQDGANYHVSSIQYDLMGRTSRVWKPYTRAVPGYDASFTSNATTFYNTYHSPSTTVPYVETTYTQDALSRVKQVTPEHLVGAPSAVVTQTYGVIAANSQQFTLVTDEAGKQTRSITDVFGNVVRSILGAGAPESTLTQFTHNVLGQRLQTTDPRSLNTTYVFNTRGLQTSRTSPDAGAQSAYDKAGNIRFTQDANQAAAGKVYFTSYDFAGRALRSGVGVATFSSLNPDLAEAFENDANCLVARQYDAKPSTLAFPWSRFNAQITPLALNNVAGRLAAVASKSNGAWQATLFNYDADGRVTNRYIFTEANGGGSVLTAINTAVADSLDLRGAILRRADTVGTSYFYQWYDYNGRGLLSKTYADTLNTKPGIADVTDSYRPSGLPQDYQFQGSSLVPIRYTIREQTERIGDPAGITYPFSARYVYQANGVVDTAEFYNGGSPAAQKRYRYVFGPPGYDALNRLKTADFSSWNGGWTVTSSYDLSAITYDASGNLLTLQRRNDGGALIDNLTYNYVAGTNRLGSLGEAAGVSTEPWDAEAGAFSYDANGNVTAAPAPYSITAVTYDPANLPLSINSASGTSTYRYDDAGQRITKQVNGGNTEVYLRKGATVLGVFTLGGNTVSSSYFNILWSDRVVGRHTSTGVRTYYHFDPLGSVRAVVLATTGAVTESSDFDPWGLAMPSRALVSATPTKEKFSGKEQDSETGLDYFGARHYMPAIGRWSTADPLADKTPAWSSYVYTNDSPVTFVDPTGRQTEIYYGLAAQEAFRHLQHWWGHRNDPTPLQRRPECQGGYRNIGACFGVATKPIPNAVATFVPINIVSAAGGELLGGLWGMAVRGLTRGAPGSLLAASEELGGHALARHVGQTTGQLVERLATQEGISAASTFFATQEAELAVSGAVRGVQPAIASWLEGSAGTLVINSTGGRVIGVVLERGAADVVTTNAFRVVLVRSAESPLGYIVKTAYPILVP